MYVNVRCKCLSAESPPREFRRHDTEANANSIPSVSSLTASAEISSASLRGLHSSEVQARLESGPCAAAHSPLAERNGFLQLRLHGYQASFLMSTLRNLAHFLEDDSAPQVLPMEISVRNTHINLKVRIPGVSSSDAPAPRVHTLEVFTQRLLLQNSTCNISGGYLSYFFQILLQ